MSRVSSGMNRRDLDAVLEELGGTVDTVPRTGEVRYRHPNIPEQPKADGRRKDAPRHLTSFVRRVERLMEEESPHEREHDD